MKNNNYFLFILMFKIFLITTACGEVSTFMVSKDLQSTSNEDKYANQEITDEEIEAALKSDILPDPDAPSDESTISQSVAEIESELEYQATMENKFMNIVRVQNTRLYPEVRSEGRYNDKNGQMKTLSGFLVWREREVSIDQGQKGFYRHLIVMHDSNSQHKILACPPNTNKYSFNTGNRVITYCWKSIQGNLIASGQTKSLQVSGYGYLSNYNLWHVYARASFIGVRKPLPVVNPTTPGTGNNQQEPIKQGCFKRGLDYFYTNGAARCEITYSHFIWQCPSKTSLTNSQFASLANHGPCRPVRNPSPGCFKFRNVSYYTNGGAYCRLTSGNTCDRKTTVNSLQFKKLANHGICR